LVDCDSSFDDDRTIVSQIEVFEDGKLTLTANTDAAYTDSLITIKMQCYPLYSGVGRAVLQIIAGDSVFIEAPQKDTIDLRLPGGSLASQTGFNTSFYQTSFIQDWQVILKRSDIGYAFEGYVFLDSIYVAPNSLVSIKSKQARELIPNDSVFRNWATSERFLFLSPLLKL
jgi:hypothetical protein